MILTRESQGTAALEAMFARAKAQQRAAFLPYFPIGYPNYAVSLATIKALADAGVDGFEIGIPFSDPIADGPTIQAATQVALEDGTTVRKCLDAVRSLRLQGVVQPMLMMGYANPLVAYGTDAFVRGRARSRRRRLDRARSAAGRSCHVLLIPVRVRDLALVFMLAPTSNDERIRLASANATGFIYVVSLTGITGARRELPAYLKDFIARLRASTDKPLVLGFGISSPEHARKVSGLTDGFIVGSALVRAGGESVEAARELAASMVAAIST